MSARNGLCSALGSNKLPTLTQPRTPKCARAAPLAHPASLCPSVPSSLLVLWGVAISHCEWPLGAVCVAAVVALPAVGLSGSRSLCLHVCADNCKYELN